MKAAFLSEFASVRSTLAQMALIYLACGIFICVGMKSAFGMVGAISAMTPFFLTFTFAGYDAMNGWERYRATLPLSRRDIVLGRYANVLACSVVAAAASVVIGLAVTALVPALPIGEEFSARLAEESDPALLTFVAVAALGIMLVVTSFLLPVVLRFGLNKAIRFVPLGMFVVIMLGGLALPNIAGMPEVFTQLDAWLSNPANIPLATAAIAGITLITVAASCLIAMRLYREKDL